MWNVSFFSALALCFAVSGGHGAVKLPAPVAVASAQPTPVEARAPKLIIIIRHAEKPPAELESPDINAAGRARAEKLALLFTGSASTPAPLPRPDALFATAPHKKSNRPAETIAPLSRALHEDVNLHYGKDDDKQLSDDLLSGRYAGKIVLVCWHHGKIPALAEDLGVASAPKWKDEVFDQVWEISYGGGSAHLTTRPQRLMPGDSTR